MIKELGRERFEGRGSNLFCTDRREVLDIGEWEEREAGIGDEDDGVLTREERELRDVRRAEEEERYSGTKGRDLMGGADTGNAGAGDEGEKTKGLRMKMADDARKALGQMGEGMKSDGEGKIVQLVRLSICCSFPSFQNTDRDHSSPSIWLAKPSSSPLHPPISHLPNSLRRSPLTHHHTPSITTPPPLPSFSYTAVPLPRRSKSACYMPAHAQTRWQWHEMRAWKSSRGSRSGRQTRLARKD